MAVLTMKIVPFNYYDFSFEWKNINNIATAYLF